MQSAIPCWWLRLGAWFIPTFPTEQQHVLDRVGFSILEGFSLPGSQKRNCASSGSKPSKKGCPQKEGHGSPTLLMGPTSQRRLPSTTRGTGDETVPAPFSRQPTKPMDRKKGAILVGNLAYLIGAVHKEPWLVTRGGGSKWTRGHEIGGQKCSPNGRPVRVPNRN